MSERPNILFLMTDQQRYDSCGFMGNEIIRTPRLDALAADAVVFDNAYTPSPICIPARQCMMAGQLPHRCGCLDFGSELPDFSMTFAKRFSQYAYNTVCCGKLHHHGADMYQGWRLRVGHDNGISPRFIPDRDEAAFAAAKGRADAWWDWNKEIRRAGVGVSPHERKDRYAVLGAKNVIEDHFLSPYYDSEQLNQPLLLKVSLRLPHYPFLCDEERFTYYLNRVPIFHGETPLEHPQIVGDWERIDPAISERDVRRATAAYYGMVEQVDDMFGEVLDALAHAGQDIDDWIVVFTTDHGDLLGEHGLWMKYKFYEGSARVPLMIRWPKRWAAKRVAENVNLCDLFATLCEAADIPLPDGTDSRSLVPLMRGGAADWDNVSISQLNRNTMIKRDHLKYMHFAGGGPDLLFDLAADPGERQNCIDDPAYADLAASLRDVAAALTPAPSA